MLKAHSPLRYQILDQVCCCSEGRRRKIIVSADHGVSTCVTTCVCLFLRASLTVSSSESGCAGVGCDFVVVLYTGGAVGSSTMANWHARDICGIVLLLLVFTEAARKWAFVQDLSNVQLTQTTGLSHDSAIYPARRLLEPQAKSGYQTKALCRTEQECEDGVGVTCMQGNVVACSCDFIAVCYPNVKRCSVYNSTHIESCGF